MGWTVLYIAFGVVALWLLGEVLLQYKARLRWRLLAFTGFLGVVLGVLLPSVLVIILGAIAFAVGQTYVTLSFRRGFSTGWALGGKPGASRRRRSAAPPPAAAAEPTAEADEPSAAETTAVYAPQPMPDDTGQYGVYDDRGHDEAAAQAPTAFGTDYGTYPPGYDQPAGQDAYAAGYDYGTGQQQYAAYSDPYIGPGTDGQQYTAYDYGNGQQQYASYPDPYGPPYGYDTPPGGVWVPQQRDNDQLTPPPMPPMPPVPQEPAPYGYDQGQGEQQPYRY
ncbi:hypothetical protein [Streptomyces purpureus]|uniref:Uncharacterized protein n=1 Tax=Streptomyces purpureus TaxID=1951 RepID=A0A918GYA9_9ACTN|nr:hypothetical protein [Streptomyces purpureus]GGT22925.1 hypothetical protein GCM10014713_14720 [Streptomyces purpureus]